MAQDLKFYFTALQEVDVVALLLCELKQTRTA